MATLIFPFALGLILVLLQPKFDEACKKNLSSQLYDEHAQGGAMWAATVASFMPAAALTTCGALVIAVDKGHNNASWVLIGAMLLLLINFALFLQEVMNGVPARRPLLGGETWGYSRLQIWLAVLNLIGIGLAIWFHYHSTEETEKPTPKPEAIACVVNDHTSCSTVGL